jgi:hypothetical protein
MFLSRLSSRPSVTRAILRPMAALEKALLARGYARAWQPDVESGPPLGTKHLVVFDPDGSSCGRVPSRRTGVTSQKGGTR